MGYAPKPLPKGFVPYGNEQPTPEWDFAPLKKMNPPVTLCYGTEWYRFPGSYLIPEGVEVKWVQTEFDGMMPRQWEKSAVGGTGSQWPREETRMERYGRFNGDNKASEEPGTFVSSTSIQNGGMLR